jgi:DNA replication licensing factor MCM2
VYYKCQRCGYLKGPFYPNNTTFFTFGACFSCHGRGPYALHTARSVYRNYQILNLQESPNDVAPGRIPRSKEIVLLGDTIDQAKPGDEVSVIGIFTTRYDSRLNIKQGFPVFHTLIEANHIEQVDKL